MARRPGPSVRSRRLAITLRRLRRDSGLTGSDVAKALNMSASKLSRVESADAGIYVDDVEMLLDFYRVPRKQRAYLLDLARRSEERGMLRMNNAALPADWQTWLEFEEEANELLFYEPMMIPGPLQTSEYTTAIIRATGHNLTEDAIEALTANRRARQGLLTRKDPLLLHAIIEQHAVERCFGGPGAHIRQLRHLLDLAELPNVTLQVLPHGVGPHPGMYGSFVLLAYESELGVVLLEHNATSTFLDEPEHMEVYAAAWRELGKLALDAEQSVEFLRHIA